MLDDKNIEQVVSTVEVFINSLSSLMTVFFNYEEGGDFCSGLIFGMNGAQMLTQIAQVTFDFLMAPPAKSSAAGGTVF